MNETGWDWICRAAGLCSMHHFPATWEEGKLRGILWGALEKNNGDVCTNICSGCPSKVSST